MVLIFNRRTDWIIRIGTPNRFGHHSLILIVTTTKKVWNLGK